MSNFLTISETKKLIALLCKNLENQTKDLIAENEKITSDSLHDINKDLAFIKAYLKNYISEHYKPNYKKHLKSKGKVLIILSFNEPFIMTIIPALNALVAGNEVYLRPSRRNIRFVTSLWGDIATSKNFAIKLIKVDIAKTYQLMDKMNGVYFFGSEINAKKIAIRCAKNLIEFHPNIEGADFAIIDDIPKSSINPTLTHIINDSFSHCGQRCQRIQGVYAQQKVYKQIVHILNSDKLSINSMDYLKDYGSAESRSKAWREIRKSQPKDILHLGKTKFPVIILSPKPETDLVKSAYFLPTLWIIPYQTKQELLKYLRGRKYFLGINYWGRDDKFLHRIIGWTRHTRFTFNTNHAKIRTSEGWGGANPSGYGGYQSWLEKFTNSYTIIQ